MGKNYFLGCHFKPIITQINTRIFKTGAFCFVILNMIFFSSIDSRGQATITSVNTTTCDGATNTYSATINYTLGASGLVTNELLLSVVGEATSEINTTLTAGNYSITITGLNADGATHNASATFTAPENTPAGSSFSFTAPASCIANNCTDPNIISGSISYSNTVPLQTTDLNNIAVPLPKFDATGGKVLQKVLISIQSSTTSTILNEARANGDSEIKFDWTSDSYLGINDAIAAPILVSNIVSDYRLVENLFKKDVPACCVGGWLGDIINSFGSGSTLERMNESNAITIAMQNFIDPRTLPEWVTTKTGNMTDDDDFTYFPPYAKAATKNSVITTGLATYTGTGDIDFRYSTDTFLSAAGGGGNNSFLTATKSQAKVTITYFYCSPAVTLAVDLNDFKAININDAIKLTWHASNEKNFSHFEIQKSNNATEFGYLAIVNANKSSIYSQMDNNPTEGVNYYRLKMVDLDGAFKFSKTLSLTYEKGGNYVSVENPSANGVIKLITNLNQPKFTLLNSLGQSLKIDIIKASDNQYLINTLTNIKGLYFLSISSNGNHSIKKILLQ